MQVKGSESDPSSLPEHKKVIARVCVKVSFFWIDEYVSLFVDDVGASRELLKELGVFFNSIFVFHFHFIYSR